MVTTVRAKFSDRHFMPIEPLPAEALQEGHEVLLTVASAPERSRSALLETAGAWKGLIDSEALNRDIYTSHLISSRSPVAL